MCPYQKVIRDDFFGTDSWKERNDYYSPLFDEMSKKWNIPRDKLDFTTSYSYVDNYYSLWFDDREFELDDLSEEGQNYVQEILGDGLFVGFFYSDLAIRLATTKFFNYVRTAWDRKFQTFNGETDPSDFKDLKLIYFSAHDGTLAAILNALDNK